LKELTAKNESANFDIAAEKRRLAEREATIYKNFAEMQRREQALAAKVEKFNLAKESADVSKTSTIKSYEDEIAELNNRISQIEQEKRTAERETREAKFLYEAMFTPYKEKALREGRSIRDVEIDALKTQLFQAKEMLHEFRINGAPELKAAQERIAALHKSNEYARQDKNSAENIANKLRNELSVLNRQLDSEKMLHQVRIQRLQNEHESVLKEKDTKIKDLTNLYDALRTIKSTSNVQKVDTSHLDKK